MNLTWKLVIGAALMVSTIVGKEKKFNDPVEKIIPITELSKADMAQAFFGGGVQNIAVECKEGMELPLKYFGNFGPFSVKFLPNLSIKVEKTCYIRMGGRKAYISYDLENWQSLSRTIEGMPMADIKINEEEIVINTSMQEIGDDSDFDFEAGLDLDAEDEF